MIFFIIQVLVFFIILIMLFKNKIFDELLKIYNLFSLVKFFFELNLFIKNFSQSMDFLIFIRTFSIDFSHNIYRLSHIY